MVLSASMARTRPPALCSDSMVVQPTVGTSKRMSCWGLATLTTTKAAATAPLAGAEDGAIGPLDGLDGEHGALSHGHALADVEPAHFAGQLPAELDVFFLGGRRAAPGEHSGTHKQLRAKVQGRLDAQAVGREFVDDAEHQVIVTVAGTLAVVPETQRAQVGPER